MNKQTHPFPMIKAITVFAALTILLCLTDRGNAQQFPVAKSEVPLTLPFFIPSTSKASVVNKPLSGENLAISYFDPSAEKISWIAPTSSGSAIIFAYGQRFTLPGDFGYVDSLSIAVDTVTTDSVSVLLMPDTLLNFGNGFFHVINIFDPAAQPFGGVYIKKEDTKTGELTKLHFDHVKVPKNFFVMIAPRINQSTQTIANAYRIISDVEPKRTRTAENTRSAFLYFDGQGNTYSVYLDGNVTPPGADDPLFVNFIATVFVDTTGASVPSSVGLRNTTISALTVSPNPVTTTSTITLAEPDPQASIRVYDALGREVLDLTPQVRQGSRSLSFNSASLPNGTYYLRYVGQQGSIVRAVTVSK